MKNRSVKNIDRLKNIISQNNSRLEGSDTGLDVRQAYADLQRETEILIRIKAAISAANGPVQASIYWISELKGRIAFLKTVSTVSGLHMQPYGMQQPQSYVATITAAEVESEIDQLEMEIDELQDLLDQHNASVKIELEA